MPDGALNQIGRRSKSVHQTQRQGLRCRNPLAGQQNLKRLRLADQARQALGSAPACKQAARDSRMAKRRVVSSDAPMAGQRQIQPAAQAVAPDGRHDRQHEALNLIAHRLAHLSKLPCCDALERRDFIQLGAGGKGFFIARNHDAAKEPLALNRTQEVAQFGKHGACDAVVSNGARQGQDGDRIAGLEVQMNA